MGTRKLNPDQREAIWLLHVAGWPNARIADLHRVTERTVRNVLADMREHRPIPRLAHRERRELESVA